MMYFLVIFVSLFFPTTHSQPQAKENSALIEGRLVDLYGNGLSGATVEIAGENGKQITSTKTDRLGRFELNKLPSGNLVLTLSQQGFQREVRKIVLASDQQLYLEFGLKLGKLTDTPTYEVRGRVRNSDSSVLQAAGVTLTSLFDHDLHYTGRSDKDGRYRIFVGTGGQYVISATYPGHIAEAKVLILPSDSLLIPTTVDFTLIEGRQ